MPRSGETPTQRREVAPVPATRVAIAHRVGMAHLPQEDVGVAREVIEGENRPR